MGKGSDEEELFRTFAEYSKYGRKFDKAIETVLVGGVKESRFLPSGRKVLTVVGTLGDEFIDPERHYCSCSNYYFKVAGGKEETCYHLLSYTIASQSGRIQVTEFSDEDYGQIVKAIVNDVFSVMDRG